MGAYACDPTGDADLVTLKTVSSQWLETFTSSHIMAAAGNEDYRTPVGAGNYVPFWPAALSDPGFGFSDRFHAVAAVDRTGTEIVWVDKNPVPVRTPGRPWVTDQAPGADLVSLSGGITRDAALGDIPALACWSGSSFAAAVASAQFALDVTPSTPDYNSAAGLTFVEPGGREVVTVGGSSTTGEECDHDAED